MRLTFIAAFLFLVYLGGLKPMLDRARAVGGNEVDALAWPIVVTYFAVSDFLAEHPPKGGER
jgi:hypothetical protein